MRAAVTIWNDRVSPVFDVARNLLVLDIENGAVTARHTESFSGDTPHQKLVRLRELRVQTLICGAISRAMAEKLSGGGIELISFVTGELCVVIAAYLERRLTDGDLSMPGRK